MDSSKLIFISHASEYKGPPHPDPKPGGQLLHSPSRSLHLTKFQQAPLTALSPTGPIASRNYATLELILYYVRDVQHHAAQLNMLLCQGINNALNGFHGPKKSCERSPHYNAF